ncbi:MAG: cytochrome P450 [Acidimicrobiales bacterium]
MLRLSEASADRSEIMNVFPPYSELSPKARLFFESWLLSKDPPDHTRIRKLVSRAFTPRSMVALEPRVAEIAASLIADTRSLDSFDIVASFGDKFPIYVIGELLGLPEADWPWLKEASDEIAKFVDPVIGFDPSAMDTMATEVSDYFSRQIAKSRDNPADDLIGRLVASEEDGDTLTEAELVSLLALVMGAGHETTTNFFGNSLVALHDNSSQRSLLVLQPELIENAVEELLRFDAPVQLTSRSMLAHAIVGGQTLSKGDDVNILLGAANRDERRFIEANTLKLDRDDPRPLSFGHGIHHCVGAALARMERRVALPMLLADLGDYTIDEVEWRRSFTLRGPKRLIVRRG